MHKKEQTVICRAEPDKKNKEEIINNKIGSPAGFDYINGV